MSKTEELKTIVTALLKQSIEQVYYEVASKKATYPYVVYSFDNINLGDMYRDDTILIVDVWGKDDVVNGDIKAIEAICDNIEKSLNGTNAPQGDSYPTFYRESRTTALDEDKSIRHKQLKFLIQSYYEGE